MQRETYVVGSTKLRNRVGRMLDDALAGHTTIIERHGRRIARVVPYREFDRIAERMAQLEALAESTLGKDWEAKLAEPRPAGKRATRAKRSSANGRERKKKAG